MATLNLGTFETGNVTIPELLDALGEEWGYSDTVADPQNPGQTIPNPETKAQFCRRNVIRILKEAYRNGKRKVLIRDAEAAVPTIDIT